MLHPYRTFNNYLKEHFGTVVYRVPIDAGFDCPNRDGTRAFGGCTFCDENGSGAPTIKSNIKIKEQLIHGIDRIKYRFGAKKFLAYFQAFTNTYAPEGVLKNLYEAALDHEDVVGLCIGTRPDCLPDNVLDMLAELNKRTFIWLEIGLQSAFNQTLDIINRAHTAEEFFDAVKRAKKRNLKVATHLIFGLPGETKEQMLSTVEQVAQTDIDGIKIHQLVIYKGTPLEKEYNSGSLQTFDEDDYVNLVADAIEMLPKDMVIMRLVAEGTKDELVAPKWALNKSQTIIKIDKIMHARGTEQGCRYQSFLTKSDAPTIPA
jgi:radical SAM protein (TIGR01212 family)